MMALVMGGNIMKISNVVEIFDNDEFVSLVTKSGSVIHLPMGSEHDITILDMENPGDNYRYDVNILMYN